MHYTTWILEKGAQIRVTSRGHEAHLSNKEVYGFQLCLDEHISFAAVFVAADFCRCW